MYGGPPIKAPGSTAGEAAATALRPRIYVDAYGGADSPRASLTGARISVSSVPVPHAADETAGMRGCFCLGPCSTGHNNKGGCMLGARKACNHSSVTNTSGWMLVRRRY